METQKTLITVPVSRKMPVGAELLVEGGVHFRLWAPRRESVSVILEGGPGWQDAPAAIQLTPEADGYFSKYIPQAVENILYRFRCDNEDGLFPDPASRFQPDGPLGPSQVISSDAFNWTDREWNGITMKGQVIYEMHIGTYTREGTWKSAAQHLPGLAETGVTVLEVMPVADFGGNFGWGYDGVDLYAPTRNYGDPDEFRSFVDKAHALGLGVILDVVYNHIGPIGDFLRNFSFDYFTDRYKTDWGDAINFDGKNSGPVREFFISNAQYWVREYHIDGFRIDATQSIFDRSPEHIIAAVAKNARAAAGRRSIIVIGENEPQDVRLIRPAAEGGFGLDALLNDDFHHSAMVALTGHNEAYYSDHLGSAQEFISAAQRGFLYQGQLYSWQKKNRGTSTLGQPAERFIHFIQNHDQVANSATGKRCHQLTSPAQFRALTALFLLGPQTPMIFQGQEFCASAPFNYFADVGEELGELVTRGRTEFLSQFRSIATPEMQRLIPGPADPGTFEQCKLDHSEKERNPHCYALHRDLLRLRRVDQVFAAQRTDWIHSAVLSQDAFVLRFFGQDFGDRLLIINFGRDLTLASVPEPLLAPPEDSFWEILWSSESPRYGGGGTPQVETEEGWMIMGHAAVVLAPKRVIAMFRNERLLEDNTM